MHDFTPGYAVLGGALIGIAAGAALLLNGRIAGISGMFAGLLHREGGAGGEARNFRLCFLGGLFVGAAVLRLTLPAAFETPIATTATLVRLSAAGLLVGFGARLGGGCTSGHGVCGLSLRSPRALAATMTFMASAFIVVFVAQHLLRAAR
jgi:hypothetical protein